MIDKVEFVASIAPTESGMKIHGIDGYRVLLDIPEGELPAVMRLALLRRMALKVTIEPLAEQPAAPTKARKGKRIEDNGETEDRDRYFTS